MEIAFDHHMAVKALVWILPVGWGVESWSLHLFGSATCVRVIGRGRVFIPLQFSPSAFTYRIISSPSYNYILSFLREINPPSSLKGKTSPWLSVASSSQWKLVLWPSECDSSPMSLLQETMGILSSRWELPWGPHPFGSPWAIIIPWCAWYLSKLRLQRWWTGALHSWDCWRDCLEGKGACVGVHIESQVIVRSSPSLSPSQ